MDQWINWKYKNVFESELCPLPAEDTALSTPKIYDFLIFQHTFLAVSISLARLCV